MSNVTKVLMGFVAVGMATTFLLPGRQTGALFSGATKLVTGVASTTMGTSTGAIG